MQRPVTLCLLRQKFCFSVLERKLQWTWPTTWPGGMRGPAGRESVPRAHQQAVARAVAERREAISRAVEREDRKKAEHDARRAVREQAGHTNSKAGGGKGRGGADKDTKARK